ncbi:MAG: methyltransferase domain-containing protein [Candidatus Sumerlaeia bacterium]|nr:methyltransferase domain-containing protein [Candidatus Sumerlaeia bacterium]
MLELLAALTAAMIAIAWLTNFISYRVIKGRTIRERRWDYNICCGTTDGGGINADIVRHGDVPNFELVEDILRLPHPDGAFEHVLCSHTLEHVDDPKAFYAELRRVGRRVCVLIPPIWDYSASLNPFEHRVIFLTMRSRHDDALPPYIEYGFARWLQSKMGQRIDADVRGGAAVTAQARMRTFFDFLVPFAFLGAAYASVLDIALWPAAIAGAAVVLWLSKRKPAAQAVA